VYASWELSTAALVVTVFLLASLMVTAEHDRRVHFEGSSRSDHGKNSTAPVDNFSKSAVRPSVLNSESSFGYERRHQVVNKLGSPRSDTVLSETREAPVEKQRSVAERHALQLSDGRAAGNVGSQEYSPSGGFSQLQGIRSRRASIAVYLLILTAASGSPARK
jgi:hypothetical protein